MTPLRILLADDHTLVRAGIRALLAQMPDVEVVGEAGDGREALALVKAHRPDVLLMDIAMTGMSGLEAIHIISHGASGQINLNAAQLSQDTLAQHQTRLATMGNIS